jgi:hypothetical protein
MRRQFALMTTLFLTGSAVAGAQSWELRVSENKRFLTKANGIPFFWLGDTAWELFHRLNREDTERYLENRRQKGFNVIQAVALAELDGLNTPNRYGEKPLLGNDPAKPNPKYFEHVDWVVNRAREKGLYIGLLPTWGRYVVKGSWEKTSEVIFNPRNARAYGRWIGARYKDTPNLVWILGGDRNPEGVVEVWRAMAEGIREGDGGKHLITFHPNGRGSSATLLHQEPWLDFNMIQSGHSAKNFANYDMIARDYGKTPLKPVLDGEPRYEDHPVNWKPQEQGWFDEVDVRQAAYWAVFAGAFGHTYGCHPIWQMASLGPGENRSRPAQLDGSARSAGSGPDAALEDGDRVAGFSVAGAGSKPPGEQPAGGSGPCAGGAWRRLHYGVFAQWEAGGSKAARLPARRRRTHVVRTVVQSAHR